jgi:hypothetical protein
VSIANFQKDALLRAFDWTTFAQLVFAPSTSAAPISTTLPPETSTPSPPATTAPSKNSQSPASSNSLSPSTVIGVSIGVSIGLVLLILLFLFQKRIKKKCLGMLRSSNDSRLEQKLVSRGSLDDAAAGDA